MNLAAYDKLDSVIDKKRSWIDINKKVLYTREISCRNYISFGKSYNKQDNSVVFYIITSDDEPFDRPSSKLILTSNGCVKIPLKTIFNELRLSTFKDRYINVYIKNIDHTDDCDVYEFQPA